MLSPDGSVVTVNQAASNLLGYSEHDLVGQPASLLFEEDTTQCILSQRALPVKRAVLRRLVEGGSVSNIEKSLLTKSGNTIPVLLSGDVNAPTRRLSPLLPTGKRHWLPFWVVSFTFSYLS